MNAEPRYNDTYYQNTTSHSQVLDVVDGKTKSLHDFPIPLDWKQLFGNTQPVEIEIGTGKGRFIHEASKQNSHINYIGVERAQKYVLITRDRFIKYLRHKCIDKNTGVFENVRIVWTDANFFLTRYVPVESVKAYHIYFPDPWPKARQQKRRIFRNRDFLSAIARTLNSEGGKLYVATDFAEYFSEIQERLSIYTELKSMQQEESDYSTITTNFERKYLHEGREIFRAIYEKSTV